MSESSPPTTDRPSRARRLNRQELHLKRAKASLRQSLVGYSRYLRLAQTLTTANLQAELQPAMQTLTGNLHKLDNCIIRIAVFGLVSRGKSAVLNALLGQKVLETGPINGVTRHPRVVRWSPEGEFLSDGTTPGKVLIELVDTPGLDEIDGQTREEMARQVASQSDLILFVVSGDITRTEYRALCDLRQAQKPLLLVFNKIDLYPEQTRQAIYRSLQQLGRDNGGKALQQLLSPEEIVMVAAEPAPLQMRVEWPDGRVTYEWETPQPQIDELKQKILTLLNQEGRSLLALNALFQASQAEAEISRKIVEARDQEAEDLIWKFTRYKALAVALNPIAVLDLVGATAADLALIRALGNLYGLPLTQYEAGKLLKTILFSSGTLLLGELSSALLLGLGKSAAAVASGLDNPTHFSAYFGAAIAQGGLAGYGAYSVGRAAQVYLEQGCSWGPQGANTVIQEILRQVEPNMILFRLRQELEDQIGSGPFPR